MRNDHGVMAIRPETQRAPQRAAVSTALGWVLLVTQALGAVGCGTAELTEEEIDRAVEVAALVERDRVMNDVEALVAVRADEEGELPPWGDDMPLVRVEARAYIMDAFRDAGLEPVEDVQNINGMETANILVDIPGAVQPDEFVVISAHYDCWYLGADDNASGVSVLLEAARIFAQAPPPARTIRLIAFDREEEGLIGSRRYVERYPEDRIAVMINLDAVGYSDSTPGSQSSIPGLTAPDTGDFLAAIGSAGSRTFLTQMATLSNRLPQPVFVLGVLAPGDGRYPGVGDLLRSDHGWFWANDVPAVFLTDTADFRNPNYHKATDLPETLDYDFLARVTALTIGAAAAFAGVP
jgi:hypothetical protein